MHHERHSGTASFNGSVFRGLLAVATASVLITTPTAQAKPPRAVPESEARRSEDGKVSWYNLKTLDVEGQGWSDTRSPFDRLPARAEGVVRPPVWSLSRHSAGICARFRTSSPSIKCRWVLISDRLDMPHMPATGVSGVDLYVKHEGAWRWLANGRPSQVENTATLASGLDGSEREYMLYLPLYNGVSEVELGLEAGAGLTTGSDYPDGHERPLVFWGTSITQGGCASRPGMVHTAILGRRLNRPVINLGFSGNGRLEKEMADLIAELDAEVFVLDCLPNLNGEQTAERIGPVIESLRAAHPDTPILMVEDRTYSNAFLNRGLAERNRGNREAFRNAYQKLTMAGVKHLFYLEGEKLLGQDGDDTVDGSHPTDLGFFRQADAFEAALKPILNAP